ncbi:somatostatin receptor type 1 [Thalassophryne amazonica]|uniref:somatostatin receptor type 1 n=1 Tax=Thalassophryne amazonica TaxID=390379 RepID=UPI00147094E4|nr:somatostatin receptor type 1 [Thalassophryne amazonica]
MQPNSTSPPLGLGLGGVSVQEEISLLNGSLNGTADADAASPGSAALISSIYSVVCLVGLCGNSMVIYVIFRYAKMKTATNIYLLNLAVADELLMLSVPFLVTAALLRHWPFGSVLCRLVLSVDAINMFTSIYCLTVLSVDRYIAVVHPIRASRYRRPTVAKMVNLCVWMFSILVILPIIIFSTTVPNSDGSMACNMQMPEPEHRWMAVFVVYAFLMGFLFPVIAICMCYILIISKLRVVALRAGWQQRKKSEQKITVMVMMVVTVFIICWMPFHVVQLVGVFLQRRDPTLSQLAVVLGYANSCANPVLYVFLSDSFRRYFQRTLCLHWMEGPEEHVDYIDYYSTALMSRGFSRHEFQPENVESEVVFHNGMCPPIRMSNL